MLDSLQVQYFCLRTIHILRKHSRIFGRKPVVSTEYTLISLINVEVGINVEGGIFLEKTSHKCNKRGVEGGKI